MVPNPRSRIAFNLQSPPQITCTGPVWETGVPEVVRHSVHRVAAVVEVQFTEGGYIPDREVPASPSQLVIVCVADALI